MGMAHTTKQQIHMHIQQKHKNIKIQNIKRKNTGFRRFECYSARCPTDIEKQLGLHMRIGMYIGLVQEMIQKHLELKKASLISR